LKDLVLEQKKEDLELFELKIRRFEDKNIFSQVRSLARPVPPATHPCQPQESSFAASRTSYLLVYF